MPEYVPFILSSIGTIVLNVVVFTWLFSGRITRIETSASFVQKAIERIETTFEKVSDIQTKEISLLREHYHDIGGDLQAVQSRADLAVEVMKDVLKLKA